MIRSSAPAQPGAAASDGSVRIIAADVTPAIADARTYFQTTLMIGAIERRAGRPAYWSAGITRIHDGTAHAVAIPIGPHGSASANRHAITENSISAHRNKRSALPMAMWIHPYVK